MISLKKLEPYLYIILILWFIGLIWALYGGKIQDNINIEPVLNDKNKQDIEELITYGTNREKELLNEQTNKENEIHSNEIQDIDNNVCVNDTKVKKKGKFISRGERLCCETLEKLYGVKFTSVRPNWLKNPETGVNLELDCYNDELKLAVEYNGKQHYKWPNFTGQTHEQFINQLRRDKLKLELCDLNNVYLITVPFTVKHDDIPQYISNYLPENIKNN